MPKIKKAKLPSLATVGAYAPGCHSFPKILFPNPLSRELLVGMPGARLELARPFRGGGMTAHCVCQFRHPGISAGRKAFWAMASWRGGLSSIPADLSKILAQKREAGKTIFETIYNPERLRRGRPFPGNLSAGHGGRHNSASFLMRHRWRPRRSIYLPPDDRSGNRRKPRLAKRSCFQIFQLLRRSQEKRRGYQIASQQRPAIHQYFPVLSPADSRRIKKLSQGAGAAWGPAKKRGAFRPVPHNDHLAKRPKPPLIFLRELFFLNPLTSDFFGLRCAMLNDRYVPVGRAGGALRPSKSRFDAAGVCLAGDDERSCAGRIAMRRASAPADRLVAVCRGGKEKAPSRGTNKSGTGLGPWQLAGPRRFARQDFTPQAVGFDSRAVQNSILTQFGKIIVILK